MLPAARIAQRSVYYGGGDVMTMDFNTLVAVAVPTVGAIVWLVRLEGRINIGDERHKDIIGRLVRIENKIDRNGHGS